MISKRKRFFQILTFLLLCTSALFYFMSDTNFHKGSVRNLLHFNYFKPESPQVAYIEIEASAVNRTPSNSMLLVYNRVPKCGSTTMRNLLARLGEKNSFTHISSTIYGQRTLSPYQERDFVAQQMNNLLTSKKPVSMDRHVYFIDFQQYSQPSPIYINMLRDPVAAFVSTFYFVRSPKRWKVIINSQPHPVDLELMLEKQRKLYPRKDTDLTSRTLVMPNEAWMNKSLSDCVFKQDEECTYVTGESKESFVSFFCGSDPECSEVNNVNALQRAKSNIENYYSVVGLVEHMSESMKVFEHYIPLFFKGMRPTFKKMGSLSRRSNETPHPEASFEIRKILEQQMGADMELYSFVRQRLFLQLRAIASLEKKDDPTPHDSAA